MERNASVIYLIMLIQRPIYILLCHMISHLLKVTWLHIHWFLHSILTCIHPAILIYFKQWYLYAILSLKRVFLMTLLFYVPPKQFKHPANLLRSSTLSCTTKTQRKLFPLREFQRYRRKGQEEAGRTEKKGRTKEEKK